MLHRPVLSPAVVLIVLISCFFFEPKGSLAYLANHIAWPARTTISGPRHTLPLPSCTPATRDKHRAAQPYENDRQDFTPRMLVGSDEDLIPACNGKVILPVCMLRIGCQIGAKRPMQGRVATSLFGDTSRRDWRQYTRTLVLMNEAGARHHWCADDVLP